jgi:hypothetical protein
MLEVLTDILKYTLPALIVFFTVHYLFKNFLNQQYRLRDLKFRNNLGKDVRALKLQAYERLILFCERITFENLSYRLVHTDMGVRELQNAMLIAIQQEFEHNITQQIYVSENLWKIIQLAKEQMQAHISQASGQNNGELLNNIHASIAHAKADPVSFAKAAIRNEAELLF